MADNTGGTNVTNAADSIDGGAGTDTLKVWGFASGDAIPQTANIENLVLDSTADAAGVNLGNFSGVTNVTISRDGGTNAYTVGSGQSVTLENFAVDAGTAGDTADLSLTYAAAATSATVNLNAITVTTVGTPADSDVEIVGGGLTAVTLNTTGAASTIQNLLTPATVVTMNVTGDKDLTITEGLDAETTKVDATNFTGKLSVVTGNTAAGTTTAPGLTVIGGSGNDTFDITASDAANYVSVSAGAGDDTIIIGDEINAAQDLVDGGAGTDTVKVSADLDAAFSDAVKNVEILDLTAAGTYAALDEFSGTQFVVSAADATADATVAAVVMQKMTSGATVSLKAASGAVTRDAADADGVSVTVSLKTDDTATTANDMITFAANGSYEAITDGAADDFETVTLNYVGTAAGVIESVDFGAASKLNIGATGEALTVTAAVVKADAAVDASTSTKAVTATFNTNAIKSYTGGTGNDTVNLGVADNLAQGKTFAGGTGTDKLTATATAGQNLGILAVTGFETIELGSNNASADTVTVDFRNVTDLTTLKLINNEADADLDSFVLNNFGTAVIAADNDTIGEINIESTQTSTSLKLGGAGNTTITTLTMDAGATTLNVESASNTSTITNIAGTSLTTINVTGAGATSLDTTLGSSVTTINASAATGAVTATLGGAGTLTGGSAGDTLGGSTGNDTITAGAGDDTITAGSGVDSINVGAGTDTVVIGAETATGQSFTAPAGNSISTQYFDIVTGMAAADILSTAYTAIDIDTAATDSQFQTIATSTTVAGLSVANNGAVAVRGTYDATNNTFVGSATGSDTLFVYDGDATAATTALEAIVLVGYQGTITASVTGNVIGTLG